MGTRPLRRVEPGDWNPASARLAVAGCISDWSRPQRRALLDGAAIFAPNVLGGELDIEHGGADLGMSHELLEGGQGDARAHHVRAEGVPEAVRIGLRDAAAGAMVTEQRAEPGRSQARWRPIRMACVS